MTLWNPALPTYPTTQRLYQLLNHMGSWQAASELGVPWTFCQAASYLVQVAGGLSLLCGLFYFLPSLTQAATNHGSLCNFYQLAPDGYGQQLTLICMGASPQGSQNQYS